MMHLLCRMAQSMQLTKCAVQFGSWQGEVYARVDKLCSTFCKLSRSTNHVQHTHHNVIARVMRVHPVQ